MTVNRKQHRTHYNEIIAWHYVPEWGNRLNLGLNAAKKILIISKNTSNKNCSELNFLQKSQWTHNTISLSSVAEGLQKLPFLKYYNIL